MPGVVIGISQPRKAVIRHFVPFFACDLAGFATNAHTRIGEETDFDIFLHVVVPTLVCALCSFANHKVARASGLHVRLIASGTLALLFVTSMFCLRARGPRRFVLFGKTALLDARSLAQFAVHIC